MRLIFAGTPGFAAAALDALAQAGQEIVLVLTQPDRASGRGMKVLASEVKQSALRHGFALFQPSTLRDPETVAKLSACQADAMVVAAYGLILPPEVLALFPYGCINIHASLLPRWRGAAPIQHALLAGDSQTGISIMGMDEGLDTGPVYTMESVAIAADETGGSLHDKLAALGARTIVQALAGIAAGTLNAHPQSKTGATYAHKITRDQARVDWTLPAARIERAIRAFNPFPGAFSRMDDQTIKFWAAEVVHTSTAEPGRVIDADTSGIVVACGADALRLTQLQRPGGKRLPVADFLRGMPIAPGQRFAD